MIVSQSREPIPSSTGRYAEALERARRTAPIPPAPAPGPQVVVWARGDGALDDRVPAVASSTRRSVLMAAVGQSLAVVGVLLGVLCYHLLAVNIATGVVIVVAALGLVAKARRVPFALWCTLGIVIGGALGRWS
jgi:hypothetical protein